MDKKEIRNIILSICAGRSCNQCPLSRYNQKEVFGVDADGNICSIKEYNTAEVVVKAAQFVLNGKETKFMEENNIKSGSNETFLKHLKLYEVPISLFIRRAKFL